MRIAIVDENISRAAVIREALAVLGDCDLFVLAEPTDFPARIGEIAPDIVLVDLDSPARDVLEDCIAASPALTRPIARFIGEADDALAIASIDAGVCAYVVAGLPQKRVNHIFDLAVRCFRDFARAQAL